MRFAILAASSLIALAAPPAQAQSDASPFQARGTEPFWSLTIDGSTMRFQPSDGRAVSVSRPRPIVGFNGERYVTRPMTVDITHVECSDGMSDHTYHDTVSVQVGGRRFKGCGGAVLSGRPAKGASLLQGEWAIRSIAGRNVVPGTNPRAAFDATTLSGTTGCNSFRGSYRFQNGRLIAGPLATTRRACVAQVNQQEQKLVELLGQRLTVSRNRDGRLVLTAPNRQTIVLAPVAGRQRPLSSSSAWRVAR
ncbi:MAG: META domain-containing protein [Sphingomonas sp.]|uniref:META domain-containing protein n=1 Tax=Sphingomonas sp. TaxID=28214 RepID=UPI001B06D08A|nr:META domain-containing protein [Sphingomonas sp.]MBO9623254.1 META domain-containing protein [Sphingomonas sp.]